MIDYKKLINNKILAIAVVFVTVLVIFIYNWNIARNEAKKIDARQTTRYQEVLPMLSKESQQLLPVGFSRSFVRGANPVIVGGETEQYSSGSLKGQMLTTTYRTSDKPEDVFAEYKKFLQNTAGQISPTEFSDIFEFKRGGLSGEAYLTEQEYGTLVKVVLYYMKP